MTRGKIIYIDRDGRYINLSTAEKLYDYLAGEVK